VIQSIVIWVLMGSVQADANIRYGAPMVAYGDQATCEMHAGIAAAKMAAMQPALVPECVPVKLYVTTPAKDQAAPPAQSP